MSLFSSIKREIKKASERSKIVRAAAKERQRQDNKKIKAAISKITSREQAIASERKERQREDTKKVQATGRAIITPTSKRTPTQKEEVKKAVVFGAGVATIGIGAGAIGLGARAGGALVRTAAGRRIIAGLSKGGIQTAQRRRIGSVFSRGINIFAGTQTARGLEDIRTRRATPFGAGLTVGLTGVLARPAAAAIKEGRQFFYPKIPRTPPSLTKIDEVVKITADKKVITGVSGTVFQPRPRGKRPFTQTFGGLFDEGGGVIKSGRRIFGVKDILKGKAGTITATTPPIEGLTARGEAITRGRPDIGFTPSKAWVESGRRKLFPTVSLKGGRGFILYSKLPSVKTPPAPTRGGGAGTITKPKTIDQQIRLGVEPITKSLRKRVMVTETQRAKGKARKELGGISRRLSPTVLGSLTAARGVQAQRIQQWQMPVVDFAPIAKTKSRGIVISATKEIQKFKTPIIDFAPSQTKIITATPPPITPMISPRIPATRAPPIIPLWFGGGGMGSGFSWGRKGKEIGGRFTRSFTANVLGYRAPKKRKYKRLYSGLELRI